MVNTTGVTGAAPIWHGFMEGALAGKATPFTRPAGIVRRCLGNRRCPTLDTQQNRSAIWR